MTDTRSTPWLVIILLLVILPVLYVLSAGPAALLFMHGYVSEETLDIVYWPLDRAADRWPIVANALVWYLDALGYVPPGAPIPNPP